MATNMAQLAKTTWEHRICYWVASKADKGSNVQNKWNKVAQRFGRTPSSKKLTSLAESGFCRLREYSPFSSSQMNVYSVRKNSDEDFSRAQRCCSTRDPETGIFDMRHVEERVREKR